MWHFPINTLLYRENSGEQWRFFNSGVLSWLSVCKVWIFAKSTWRRDNWVYSLGLRWLQRCQRVTGKTSAREQLSVPCPIDSIAIVYRACAAYVGAAQYTIIIIIIILLRAIKGRVPRRDGHMEQYGRRVLNSSLHHRQRWPGSWKVSELANYIHVSRNDFQVREVL